MGSPVGLGAMAVTVGGMAPIGAAAAVGQRVLGRRLVEPFLGTHLCRGRGRRGRS